MVGYPESLTDPSYSSQILILTYPMIGNYGVPERPATADSKTPAHVDEHNVAVTTQLLDQLPLEFESSHIHISALVVANYHPSFSHHLANSSLSAWLKEQGIPAIWGVDTRMLTKKLRSGGSILGRVLTKKAEPTIVEERGRVLGGVQKLFGGLSASPMARSSSTEGDDNWKESYESIPFSDPNSENLVAKVSVKETCVYTAITGSEIKINPKTGKPIRVLAVDVGMKWNQIRCFRNRGVEVKVVPWVCLLYIERGFRLMSRTMISTPRLNTMTVSLFPTVPVTRLWSRRPLQTFRKPSMPPRRPSLVSVWVTSFWLLLPELPLAK